MYIDRKEALRYMGYRGQKIDDKVEKLLDACIDEITEVSKNSFTYEIFEIERAEDGLLLKGTNLILRGSDISAHLSKSDKCAVMAATLGLEADRRISLYSRTDLAKGLVFDACAASAVESLCDAVQAEIEGKAKAMGFEITSRYSPGYGDFSIDHQRGIARVLKVYERIGISVNENSIMIPRKSVTAVIGFQKDECSVKKHDCRSCKDSNCIFRKDGNKNE